jgi:hypothetical protein
MTAVIVLPAPLPHGHAPYLLMTRALRVGVGCTRLRAARLTTPPN